MSSSKRGFYFSKEELIGNYADGLHILTWNDKTGAYTHSISKKVGTTDVFRYVEFDLPLMSQLNGKVHLYEVQMFVGKKVMDCDPKKISKSFDAVFSDITNGCNKHPNGRFREEEIYGNSSVPDDMMAVVDEILQLCDPVFPKSAADIEGILLDRYVSGKFN